jgi:hypothetical protein
MALDWASFLGGLGRGTSAPPDASIMPIQGPPPPGLLDSIGGNFKQGIDIARGGVAKGMQDVSQAYPRGPGSGGGIAGSEVGQGLTGIMDWLGDTALLDKIRGSTLQVTGPQTLRPMGSTPLKTGGEPMRDPGSSPIYNQGQLDALGAKTAGPTAPDASGEAVAAKRRADEIDKQRKQNQRLVTASQGLQAAARGQETTPARPAQSTAPSGVKVEGPRLGKRQRRQFLSGGPSVTRGIFGGF